LFEFRQLLLKARGELVPEWFQQSGEVGVATAVKAQEGAGQLPLFQGVGASIEIEYIGGEFRERLTELGFQRVDQFEVRDGEGDTAQMGEDAGR
jgi:hypothetical protein